MYILWPYTVGKKKRNDQSSYLSKGQEDISPFNCSVTERDNQLLCDNKLVARLKQI